MPQDLRGIAVTTSTEAALAPLEGAVQALLGHRAELPALLARCFMADADLVVAHVLAGFGALVQARAELRPVAAEHLAAARRSLHQRGGTGRERQLVRALSAWQEHGRMEEAAARLDAITEVEPLDALSLKLSHSIRFMLGDAAGMLQSVADAAPAWTGTTQGAIPGTGHILGMHAFALEENNDIRAAEEVGRRGVALEPRDVWGWHAVAHVMESQGRAREGLNWIGALEPQIEATGSFGRHLLWHSALFHLHLGDTDAALALYDVRIHDRPAEDVRDFANAASLLWRLEAQGVPVGQARWNMLADVAARRVNDEGLVFIDLHHLLALGAAGRELEMADKLVAMRRRAMESLDSQAEVAARAGLPAGWAITRGFGKDPAGAVDLWRGAREYLPGLGGSLAQRDLFDRMAIDAAIASGRVALAVEMLRDRGATRSFGAWEGRCRDRLDRMARLSARRATPSARPDLSLVGLGQLGVA